MKTLKRTNARNATLWIGCVVILFFYSMNSFAQSSLEGTWENASENVKLKILSDQNGSFNTGNKEFTFKGPCAISNSLGSNIDLEFKITVGTETKTVYVLVKQLSSTQIKFIGFLSKEDKDSAADEIKNSGIILTKSND